MNSSGFSSQSDSSLSVRDMTLIALMTAVLCILGPLAIPVPFSPVPVSFTNLALYLIVYILDFKCSLLCYTIYYLLGSAGLPIFSGFRSGFGHVAGPTGGYLLGFFLQTAVSAYFMKHWKSHRFMELLGLTLGTIACYGFGTLWLSHHLHISLSSGLTVAVLPYLPGDILKIIAASLLGTKLRKNLQKARH